MNNTNNGIVAYASCYVVDNLAGNNGKSSGMGAGILVTGPGNRVVNNDITANFRGIVVDGGEAKGNWIGDNAVVDSDSIGILTTNNAINNIIIRNAAGSDVGIDYIILGNQYGAIQPFAPTEFTNVNAWGNMTLKP